MTPLQQKILDAALPLIVFEGWTMRTLGHAAETLGLPKIDAERAFPGGVVECLMLWSQENDRQMETTLNAEYNLESMKIRQRIATAVLVRLRMHQPHREAIRRAVAHMALPWNAPKALSAAYRTADCMWRAAGDRSTDYNFYTKRALLVKVYSSTLMIWLNDDSTEQAETEAFLYRRIEDVMKIEQLKSKGKKLLDKVSFSFSSHT